jgi:hypothetical protein
MFMGAYQSFLCSRLFARPGLSGNGRAAAVVVNRGADCPASDTVKHL